MHQNYKFDAAQTSGKHVQKGRALLDEEDPVDCNSSIGVRDIAV